MTLKLKILQAWERVRHPLRTVEIPGHCDSCHWWRDEYEGSANGACKARAPITKAPDAAGIWHQYADPIFPMTKRFADCGDWKADK